MTHILVQQVYGDFDVPRTQVLAVGDEADMNRLAAELTTLDPRTREKDGEVDAAYRVQKVPDGRQRHLTARELLK